MYRNAKRGYTIIELLVVLVIIGLLISMAATSYNTAQKRSRDDVRKSQVNAISLAVETFYSANHRFPGKYTSATDGTNAASAGIFDGCEQYDTVKNEYYYYYFPTALSSGTTALPCDQRNGGQSYTSPDDPRYAYVPADFSPAPTWIPKLGPYLNPFPVDGHYRAADGTPNSLYDPANDVLDSNAGTNQSRTYVYRRLQNGYMVYTSLESGATDSDAYQSGTSLTDQPLLPGNLPIAIGGTNVFLVRK